MACRYIRHSKIYEVLKSTLHDRVTGKVIFGSKCGPSLYIIYIIGFYSSVWIRRKICLQFVFCCKKIIRKSGRGTKRLSSICLLLT